MFFAKESPLPVFGSIEIKRADSPILTLPRRQIITLSRTASTALQQAAEYVRQSQPIVSLHDSLFVGGFSFVFVIMGLSDEIVTKVTSALLEEQFRRLVPRGCQILPYDTLLKLFEQSIPPRIILLVPAADEHELAAQLYSAINREEFDRAIHLLREGADVCYEDPSPGTNNGLTALHWASFHGNEGLVNMLLDRGAWIDAKDVMGRTPLVCAAMTGQARVVKLLLDINADVRSLGYHGWMAIPSQRRNPEVVRLLEEHGFANPTVRESDVVDPSVKRPECAFCPDPPQRERLIAASTVFICGTCATAANALFHQAEIPFRHLSLIESDEPERACTLCGNLLSWVNRLVVGRNAAICSSCAAAAREIAFERWRTV